MQSVHSSSSLPGPYTPSAAAHAPAVWHASFPLSESPARFSFAPSRASASGAPRCLPRRHRLRVDRHRGRQPLRRRRSWRMQRRGGCRLFRVFSPIFGPWSRLRRGGRVRRDALFARAGRDGGRDGGLRAEREIRRWRFLGRGDVRLRYSCHDAECEWRNGGNI